jgi:hypothetical protein
MSSELDFGDFIPRDDMPLCDMMDHGLSVVTIGIRFSNKAIARALDVIDCSLTTSSYGQIYGSMFIMTQHIRRSVSGWRQVNIPHLKRSIPFRSEISAVSSVSEV